MNLEKITTNELVKELMKREGVSNTIVEPNKELNCKVDGPAIVITVID